MPEKKKNSNKGLREFLRYRRGEMTGKERNAFERELQKDPFSEEATDGLASISPDEALKDIAILKKHLKTRTVNRQKFMIYRIAASVAVLMIISSVFIIVERNKPERQLSETADKSSILEIKESKPLRAPEAKEDASERLAILGSEKAGKLPDKKTITVNNNKTIPVEDAKVAAEQAVNQIPENKAKATEKIISAGEVAVPVAIMAKDRPVARKNAEQTEAKKDSHVMGIPDTSASALSEVVVVGYGRSKAVTENNESLTGYSPPLPAIGKTAFDNYIRENLRHPDSTATGQRIVVVVKFIVQNDGKIDSIRIVRSPGKSFSDEAIRLIKSGPAWKPAQDNGKVIADEVRIRFVFR